MMIVVGVIVAVWLAALAWLSWEARIAPLLDDDERPVDEPDELDGRR